MIQPRRDPEGNLGRNHQASPQHQLKAEKIEMTTLLRFSAGRQGSQSGTGSESNSMSWSWLNTWGDVPEAMKQCSLIIAFLSCLLVGSPSSVPVSRRSSCHLERDGSERGQAPVNLALSPLPCPS